MLRAVLLGLALALAAAPAWAQRKYAVLSVVGENMTIVHRMAATGAEIDANHREPVDVAGPGLDNAAMAAAEDGLKVADRNGGVFVLAPRGPLAVRAANAVRDGNLERWVATEARAQLASIGVDDLIVISKHRGEAPAGAAVEGLGFYVDTTRDVLASYAYLKVSLLDLQSGRLLAEQVVASSDAAVPGAQNAGAWADLTPEQKVAALRKLLAREVKAAIPPLLTSAAKASPGRR